MKRRANGEGTLRVRADGRWESTIMIGWQPDGRRRYKSFYGKTQSEVRKKAQDWKKHCSGNESLSEDILFEQWADMWFSLHKNNISPTTQESYQYTLRALKLHFGRKKISEIRAYDIDSFIQQLRDSGRAASTLAQYKGMLYQIFQKAEANDLISKNPVRFAEKIRTYGKQKTRDAFTAEEVRLLMCNLKYDRTGMSIRLLLGTGMRAQELLALEPRHIAEDGSEIFIEQALQLVKGTVHVGPPKTNRSVRAIPVPSSLRRFACALRSTDKKYIWEEKKAGSPCNPTFFREEFRKAVSAVDGVRILTPHSCRHTYVSQMQALGVDIETIQSIVGHSSLEMTKHYLHVQRDSQIAATERFDEVFFV